MLAVKLSECKYSSTGRAQKVKNGDFSTCDLLFCYLLVLVISSRGMHFGIIEYRHGRASCGKFVPICNA